MLLTIESISIDTCSGGKFFSTPLIDILHRRGQDFLKGGHTVSKEGYSFVWTFSSWNVTAFSPPVLGYLVKKGLQKGGHRHPRTPPGYALEYFIPCYARVLSLPRKIQMKWNAQWKIVFVGSLCICIFINKVTVVDQNNRHSFDDNNPRDPLPHPRWISRIHSTKKLEIPKTWVGVWCRISGRLPHNVKMNKAKIYSDIKRLNDSLKEKSV